MSRTVIAPPKRSSKGHTIGRQRFAKISAVEGIHLTPATAADFQEFDKQKLGAEERRRILLTKYGKRR
jgi:hypothetical protein